MTSYLQPIPRVAATEDERERVRVGGTDSEATPTQVQGGASNAAQTSTPLFASPIQTGSPAQGPSRPRIYTSLPPSNESQSGRSPPTDCAVAETRLEEGTQTDAPPPPPAKPSPIFPAGEWSASGDRMPEPEVRAHTGRSRHSMVRRQSAIDWIVPHGDELKSVSAGAKLPRDRTVGDRLDPTLIKAQIARESFAFQAKLAGYALNGAIGMQVVLGALTTGLSVVTTGKQTSIMTAILGGISTIVASYLARARGSNEPENSLAKIKDLEQFIRDLEAFRLDHGHVAGDKHDTTIGRFRERFEELLGHVNAEQHTTPPA